MDFDIEMDDAADAVPVQEIDAEPELALDILPTEDAQVRPIHGVSCSPFSCAR